MLRPSQLAAFSALLFAQPVFDLLLQFPQYFIASGADRGQLVLLALLLSAAPATGLLLIRWLVGLTGRRALTVFDTLIVAFMGALLCAQLLNAWSWQTGFIGISAAFAVVFTWLFSRTRFIPMLCSWLWPALVLVPAMFVYQVFTHPHLSGNLQHYADRTEFAPATPHPVIYLVLDELPMYSMLRPDGSIDAARFPQFARLAATSTWYSNASTVADSTETALPSLLTGALPDGSTLPATFSAHPNNLFVSLAPHLQMNVQEPITRLCPTAICGDDENATRQATMAVLLADAGLIWLHRSSAPQWRRELPPIDENWSGFTETAGGHKHFAAGKPRFDFLQQIAAAAPQSFNFAHIYLPHVPWKFLPSGAPYAGSNKEFRLSGARRGDPIFRWADDPDAIAVAYQRHLMQTAYTDRWLGQLMDAIANRGLWDDALVIVAADHGVSFKAGSPRRWVEAANMPDIMSIPLFVKYPGQQQGTINSANAMSVDIVATIADVLGLPLWWQLDGVSLRDTEGLAARQQKTFYYKVRDQATPFTRVSVNPSIMDAPDILARRQAIFGPAMAEQGLFDISTQRQWLGQTVTGALTPSNYSASISGLQRLLAAREAADQRVPAFVRGQLETTETIELAIALNGVIRATARTFSTQPGKFGVVLDEQFLLPQGNQLDLYELTEQGLRPIPLTAAP